MTRRHTITAAIASILAALTMTAGANAAPRHIPIARAETCSNFNLYHPHLGGGVIAFSVNGSQDQAECSVDWYDFLTAQYYDGSTWREADCAFPLGVAPCDYPTPAPGVTRCDQGNSYCANTLVTWSEWDFPITHQTDNPINLLCSYPWRIKIDFYDADSTLITTRVTPTRPPSC